MVRIFRPTKQIHFLGLIQRLNSNSLQILKNKENSHQALVSLCHPQSMMKPRQAMLLVRVRNGAVHVTILPKPLPKSRIPAKGKLSSHQSKFCLSSLFCSILLFLFCFIFGLSYCFLSRTRSPKKEEKRM